VPCIEGASACAMPATPDVHFADEFVRLASAEFSVRVSVRESFYCFFVSVRVSVRAMMKLNGSSAAAVKPGMIEDHSSDTQIAVRGRQDFGVALKDMDCGLSIFNL